VLVNVHLNVYVILLEISKCIYWQEVLRTNEYLKKFILPEEFIIIFEIFVDTMLFLFLLAFVDRFAAICLCLFMHTIVVMHTLGVMFPKVYTYTCCFVCLHIEEKFNKINILLEDVLNIKGHSQFSMLNIPKVDNVSTIFL